MNKCVRCGGELKDTVLEHYERWSKDEDLVVFEGVPAQECKDCGETYFDAVTSKKMEEKMRGG